MYDFTFLEAITSQDGKLASTYMPGLAVITIFVSMRLYLFRVSNPYCMTVMSCCYMIIDVLNDYYMKPKYYFMMCVILKLV